MFEPADNPEINSLQAPSDQGFYALIVGDILTESRKYSHHTMCSQHNAWNDIISIYLQTLIRC